MKKHRPVRPMRPQGQIHRMSLRRLWSSRRRTARAQRLTHEAQIERRSRWRTGETLGSLLRRYALAAFSRWCQSPKARPRRGRRHGRAKRPKRA